MAVALSERVVVSHGVPIAVQDLPGGPGTPILLVHGGTRSLADWDGVAPLLADHHRVVSIDVRGHGRSIPAPTWTFDEVSEDIDAVVAELGLGAPIVCGHSMGGVIAVLYARSHPDCPAIINVDGSGCAMPDVMPGVDDGVERMRAIVRKAAADLHEKAGEPETGDAAWVESRIAELRKAVAGTPLDADLIEAATRRLHAPVGDERFQASPTPREWVTAYDAIIEADTFAALRELRCPVLWVKATRQDPDDGAAEHADLLTAHAAGCEILLSDLAAHQPGFRLEHADTGHMVNLEQPGWLAERILDFTREHGFR